MTVVRMLFPPDIYKFPGIGRSFGRVQDVSKRLRLILCVAWSLIPVGFSIFEVYNFFVQQINYA